MRWRRASPSRGRPKETTMNQQTFETELKREGYDVITNTTPGVKVNPEHSHPFDVKAMVLKGALTLHRDGTSRTYRASETFAMPGAACIRRATAPKAPWCCSAARPELAPAPLARATRESDEGTGARLAVGAGARSVVPVSGRSD